MAAAKLLLNTYRSKQFLLFMLTCSEIQEDPIEGCAFQINDANVLEWTIWMEGPRDTP